MLSIPTHAALASSFAYPVRYPPTPVSPFRNLEEDLIVRKIPFKEAQINLEVELKAREFGVYNMLRKSI